MTTTMIHVSIVVYVPPRRDARGRFRNDDDDDEKKTD
jgi:hypothetical protein